MAVSISAPTSASASASALASASSASSGENVSEKASAPYCVPSLDRWRSGWKDGRVGAWMDRDGGWLDCSGLMGWGLGRYSFLPPTLEPPSEATATENAARRLATWFSAWSDPPCSTPLRNPAEAAASPACTEVLREAPREALREAPRDMTRGRVAGEWHAEVEGVAGHVTHRDGGSTRAMRAAAPPPRAAPPPPAAPAPPPPSVVPTTVPQSLGEGGAESFAAVPSPSDEIAISSDEDEIWRRCTRAEWRWSSAVATSLSGTGSKCGTLSWVSITMSAAKQKGSVPIGAPSDTAAERSAASMSTWMFRVAGWLYRVTGCLHGVNRLDEHRENRAEQRHQAAGAARHEESQRRRDCQAGVVAPQAGVDLLGRRAQTVGEQRTQGCAGEGGRCGDSA
jgi:hypothetical protein